MTHWAAVAVWKHRGKWRAAHNRVHLGVYYRKRDADQAVAEYLAGMRAKPGDTTVAEWRARWLALQVGKRESTVRGYEAQTRRFAEAHGAKPIAAVSRLDAAEWAARHPSHARELHRMFRAAVDLDLLDRSPFQGVVQPRYRRKLDPGWLTAADVTRLEQAARDCAPSGIGPILSAMITTAAWTGIRPGEMWALDPADITPGRVTVRGSVDSHTGTVGATKNGRTRVVVLPPPAEQAIADLHDTLTFLYPAGRPAALFPTLRGTRWTSPAFAFHWKAIRAVSKVHSTMALYELRHFAATRLLEAGLSVEDVAHQLGHTDKGRLVAAVYGHPDDQYALERIDEAVERLQFRTTRSVRRRA